MIYTRWISLLESMSWHAKALVIRFFLAEEYLKQGKAEAAIKVYEDLLEGFQSNQPTKLPALLFNGGIPAPGIRLPAPIAIPISRNRVLHPRMPYTQRTSRSVPMLRSVPFRDCGEQHGQLCLQGLSHISQVLGIARWPMD